MAGKNTEYTSAFFIARTTTSVTVDLRTIAGGPIEGAGTATVRDLHGCRAIMVTDVTAGTTLEVTRLDGTQVVVSKKCAANVEYPIQCKKVLPGTSVTSYLVLW